MISCHWECIIIKSLNTVLDAVLTSVFMQLILSVNNVISAAIGMIHYVHIVMLEV